MDATQTAEGTEQGTEQAGAAKTEETKPESVSMERFKEQEAKLKAAEEQNTLLQQNQALLNANAAAPKQEEFNIYKHVGLNPDDPTDMPTQEQTKKINAYFQGITQRQNAQIRFLVEHPDYPQLVGTTEQTQSGQFAEPLKEAIRANPTLLATIQNSADPMKAAYTVAKIQAKKTAAGDTTKTTKTEAQTAIDEAVENATRVKTAANTAGGAGMDEKGSVATMSDGEFIKLANACGADL